jgi:hypothetical protein
MGAYFYGMCKPDIYKIATLVYANRYTLRYIMAET